MQNEPAVISIKVSAKPLNNVTEVMFEVNFNHNVTGVDVSDFVLEASEQIKRAQISSIEGSGAKYVVSVNSIPENADGYISIDLKNSDTGIVNSAGVKVKGFTNGLYHYVGAAFDISRAVYAGDSEAFSYANQELHAFSLEFKPDGSEMFVTGFNNKKVFKYNLSVPFDVSTARYSGGLQSFSVFEQENNPRSLNFDPEGSNMFLIGAAKDSLFQFKLSRPFDVSSAVYKYGDNSYSVKAQANFPYSFSFNNDGTALFVLGLRRGAIFEYSLSSPFNISTIKYLGDEESYLLNMPGRSAVSFKFNPDGTKVFVVGIKNLEINEYSLSQPFDISTAQGAGELEKLPIGKQDQDPRSITFNQDGTKMFILANGIDKVLEYHLDSEKLLISEVGLWKKESKNPTESLINVESKESNLINLKAQERNVVFRFSTNSVNSSDIVEYQTLLEGAEEYWSEWTSAPQKQFDRLSHGSYTFKVKARNRYGQESAVSKIEFTIQTPWYFTVWAYVLYGLLLVLLVWRIVKFNTQRLEKEKRALELVVQERTEEIASRMEEVESANVLIKEQADRLQELDKVKSRFFANISHELRTPLTLINAPLEALIENGKIEDQETLETLGIVKKNGGSLLSLVEEILDLTKLEAGKLKLIKNPVRLSEFINDLSIPYKQNLKAKSIDFNIDLGPEPDLTLSLDANKASKILNNLLSNAMKFTPKGGFINLSVRYSDENKHWLSITVEDNGEGISSKDLPNIFDRFYQTEHSDKKASGGTGIGLALASDLANLFGGNLSAESTLGKGSKFKFDFPYERITSDLGFEPTENSNTDLENLLTETIEIYNRKFEVGKPVLLVTEDHPEMRLFIVKTLQPFFEIIEAENGEVALKSLKENRVDIVISDVMMPVMDGFELLEAIKADEALHEVSVIMLTARTEQEDKLFALTLGIDDYLTKPFSAPEFLARIKNILQNRIRIFRELKGLGAADSEGFSVDLAALMKAHDLSEREVEVIRLITKRYTNTEIADKLSISKNTVKFHIRNIYSKLDIKGRADVLDKVATFSS
ncbi:ATP-binding protein [Roseivirga sp.]|uniref:ATP-binding protein n=1 Tax=Roseivirga sp. TaxID=1964215 RepID=UPI003BAD8B33